MRVGRRRLCWTQLDLARHVGCTESMITKIETGRASVVTRIEGSKLTDREVERLQAALDIKSFASRDEQEVAGYAGAMAQGCHSPRIEHPHLGGRRMNATTFEIPVPPPLCFTRFEFADALRVSVRTVDRMIAAGEIRVRRIRGKAVRILRSDVERYLEKAEG